MDCHKNANSAVIQIVKPSGKLFNQPVINDPPYGHRSAVRIDLGVSKGVKLKILEVCRLNVLK